MPHQAKEIKDKLAERKAQGFSDEDLKHYFGQLKEDIETIESRQADANEQKKQWNNFWHQYLKKGWKKFRKNHGLHKDIERKNAFRNAPDFREAVIQFQDKVIENERVKNREKLEREIANEDNEKPSHRWEELQARRDLEDEIYRFQEEADTLENKWTFSLSRSLNLYLVRPLENAYHICAEWFEQLGRRIRHQTGRAGQHLSECGETISISIDRATDAPFSRLGSTVATAFVVLGRKISDVNPVAASRRTEQEARLFNDEFANRFQQHKLNLFAKQRKLEEFGANTDKGMKPTT